VARPPSCAAALAAAQLSAVPDASRLALGHEVTANAGTAASIMIAPAEMERQDFKDIGDLRRFLCSLAQRITTGILPNK
jgi:hypothetical protein